MRIHFFRDDEPVASITKVRVLSSNEEHMTGYKKTDRLEATPLLFNLKMMTIRNLTMKNVSFNVTAYVLQGSKVAQIILMNAGSRDQYVAEPSNQIIEIPSDLDLDVSVGDTVLFIREDEEGA